MQIPGQLPLDPSAILAADQVRAVKLFADDAFPAPLFHQVKQKLSIPGIGNKLHPVAGNDDLLQQPLAFGQRASGHPAAVVI